MALKRAVSKVNCSIIEFPKPYYLDVDRPLLGFDAMNGWERKSLGN
jgi:hypothetical protein